MAAEFESGLIVGAPAWHRLGHNISKAPSLREGIKLAEMNWNVGLIEVFGEVNMPDGTIKRITFDGHKGVYRDKDYSGLGIVGDWYNPLQNVEAFEFFEPFVQNGTLELETAMSLRHGRVIVVTCKLAGMQANVSKGDSVRPYWFLSSSHDGSRRVTVQSTAIRAVCMNTTQMVWANNAEPRATVKHTKNLQANMRELQAIVDCTNQSFTLSIEKYKYLRSKACNVRNFRSYVQDCFEIPQLTEKEIEAGSARRLPRAFADVEAYFEHDRLANQSWWGAYNAITGYVDHVRGRTDESRADASLFGPGAMLRARAFDLAMSGAERN